jgi:glycosyltransferase involved in cell wall biosynthesis/GT2 family glycosyltransferase
MLVSVVIPTFNRKEILRKTLLSFQNQTSKDFEIIVADDGSTDGTDEMVKSLKVPYPIKHVWQKNAGRSAARNIGVKNSIGSIILFVDDHIIVDKKLIEEHLSFHKNLRNTNVGVIRGRIEFTESSDETPKQTKYLPEDRTKKFKDEQNPLMMFHTNNISVRKDAFVKVGGFDEDFREYGFQDQELGYRLRRAGYKYKFNPNAVGYIFRVEDNYEKWCDKAVQAGRSAVLFYRKHPFFAFLKVGVNPANAFLHFIFSINNNWALRQAERKLKEAAEKGDIKSIQKRRAQIKFLYFLRGLNEAQRKIKNKTMINKSIKNNILLVSHQSDLSGAPTSLLLLAKHLNKALYNVTFTVPKDGPLVKRLKEEGIEVITTGTTFQTLKIFKLIKKRKINIVHANTTTATYGALAGKLARIPVIWHIREDLSGRPALTQLIRLLSDKVIVLSLETKSRLKQFIPESTLAHIPNGIDVKRCEDHKAMKDIRKELKIDPNSPIVGMVGSIEERKGIKYLIEAASLVKKEIPDVNFVFVGAPLPGNKGYQGKMEKLAEDLGLKDTVKFVGQKENVLDYLSAFDIFVLPSLWEGMSRVILEAMACGKPVIATSVGGTPEIIESGKSGILVPPENSSALLKVIIEALEDKEKLNSLAQAGKKRIEEDFSIEKCTNNIEALYKEIL